MRAPSQDGVRQTMSSYEPYMQAVSRKINLESRRKACKRSIVGMTILLSSIYLLLGEIFAVSVIRGDSMEPLMHNGDVAIFFRLGDYKSGDVVILRVDQVNCVKRIVGMGQDVVMVDQSSGEVFVNGTPERYSEQSTYRRQDGIAFPATVPNGSVFVLGDNRRVSKDSREFGSVDDTHLVGTLLCVLPISSAYTSVRRIVQQDA